MFGYFVLCKMVKLELALFVLSFGNFLSLLPLIFHNFTFPDEYLQCHIASFRNIPQEYYRNKDWFSV